MWRISSCSIVGGDLQQNKEFVEVGIMSSNARERINGDDTPCAADAILHAYAGDTIIATTVLLLYRSEMMPFWPGNES